LSAGSSPASPTTGNFEPWIFNGLDLGLVTRAKVVASV
jgi:hypothetical protein